MTAMVFVFGFLFGIVVAIVFLAVAGGNGDKGELYDAGLE